MKVADWRARLAWPLVEASSWLDGYRSGPRRSRLFPWRRVWPRPIMSSRRTLWVEWYVAGVRWPTVTGQFEAFVDVAELMEAAQGRFADAVAVGDWDRAAFEHVVYENSALSLGMER